MIVNTLEALEGSERDVTTPGKWNSVRMLVADDKMGFSFHITTIFAGAKLPIEYKNHLEACYCIKGCGVLTETGNGKKYDIQPGMFYALDKHDKHEVEAFEDIEFVCVFNPAVIGNEKHNADGGYDAAME